MTHSIRPPAGPATVVDDISAPLLSPETIAEHRRYAAAQRWPKAKLTGLYLDVCEAERAVHAAIVAGDAEARTAAEWRRSQARGVLTAEREAVADTFLSLMSHAIDCRPHETADLFARAFALPAVRAAVVPHLETLLRPVVDWVRGEQSDLAGRVTDLESAYSEMGVMA